MLLRLLRLLNLRTGASIGGTVEDIEANIELRGSVLWILMCAALLASIGLDTNSAAVIIGAMLISPLMGPILGVGMSLGINDSAMFRHALRQLGLATAISLVASVLYFSLTPLGQATPELLARTHPTLLDVLIALFGGVAGIISSSRRDKTNAIPGVAIATALMPPLCTAGFGLAHLNWSVFLGALYLYCINAAFISLATYMIVRVMRFPQRTYVEEGQQRRVNIIMGLLLALIVAPSVYFLVSVYRQERDRRIVEEVVVDGLRAQGNEVLRWDIAHTDSTNLVRVYFSGLNVVPRQVAQMEKRLRQRDLKNYQVEVSRVNISKEEVAQLSEEAARNLFQNMQLEAELTRAPTIRTTSSPASNPLPSAAQVLREVRAAFPRVAGLSVARPQTDIAPDTLRADTLLTVAVAWQRPDTVPTPAETQRLYQFLQARLQQDTLVLSRTPLRPVRQPAPRAVPITLPQAPTVPKTLNTPTPAARR
ncbi:MULTISPECIES: DUF389 domain-containing protein [Hymenobacter]|uniref:DUF389 domain-containing protein n=1 Tax=Hymenobacter profundi TaxID=1982110 RepID=A0ABS6X0T3_9BACT|nr:MULTISPECIES: DUF389 domain-containing protein [Hymenobacter]MBW3129289.1 DUF389 domain-containing protein [Hymenobacter profundi]QNE39132.1 DUF389 domain-containing protein [Hymenobacter sp. NBH84]